MDEDLEEETKEECEKYGKVVKCVIFEVSAKHPETMEGARRSGRGALAKIRCAFRSRRCPTTKQLGYFWSLSGWSQPSKVSEHTHTHTLLSETLWVKILNAHCRFELPLVAPGGGASPSTASYQLYVIVSSLLNCVTALIMRVKVCPPSK